LIRFDTATHEVLIERWFRHNPPMNPMHKQGTMALIEKIKSAKLQRGARDAMEKVLQEKQTRPRGTERSHTRQGAYDLNDTVRMRQAKR
jgi:hypothetical protein